MGAGSTTTVSPPAATGGFNGAAIFINLVSCGAAAPGACINVGAANDSMVTATGACKDAESNRAETGPRIEVGFANDSLFCVTGAFDEAATGPHFDLESANDSLLAVTGAWL